MEERSIEVRMLSIIEQILDQRNKATGRKSLEDAQKYFHFQS